MLPDNWRIQFHNGTSVTIDASKITVKAKGKYFNSSGKLVYEGDPSNIANQGSTIANNAYHNADAVDNGAKTDPCVEADVYLQVDLSANTATPNGDVTVYLQRSSDDTPDWPTDGLGEVIEVFNFPNSKVNRQSTVTLR